MTSSLARHLNLLAVKVAVFPTSYIFLGMSERYSTFTLYETFWLRFSFLFVKDRSVKIITFNGSVEICLTVSYKLTLLGYFCTGSFM
jgi:hypothetical protein